MLILVAAEATQFSSDTGSVALSRFALNPGDILKVYSCGCGRADLGSGFEFIAPGGGLLGG